MREIKFRGKRKDNGEWVYGCPLETKMSGVYIIGTKTKSKPHKIGGEIASVSISDVVWQHEVDPDTVGQYTGLHDKNGKEIYEGDIVKRTCDLIGAEHDNFTGVVKFECAAFMLENFDKTDGRYLWDDVQELEILGNIYENPELLAANASSE